MCASTVKKGHVNFGSENFVPKDNTITIRQTSPGQVQIGLGFLRYQHTYSISIDIPKFYFMGYELESILDAAEKSEPNVNCKIVNISEKENTYEITVEFHANKERLLKEELTLSLENNDNLTIEFIARVLGPGKGTPLLKNGIKCIGVSRDELSDT
ncbi:conserved hypothetical protein [Pediculus humanus corporis]|uniref:Adipose-secreted signaling protein n=1 Tax=Pediculus humanus subsp. corporis TaxID=121224 RepID=E0VHK5_PEDHC|nr:uncharacterized protein Phum_PHUM212680 [Pediculus humanus corporis]EEB12891.1 conserved hypothetical protein [Pediculus humanus corporis]